MQTSNLPIGVFDSGLGGLTIVRSIKETLPAESLIYYGDTAHLPYGDKSPELIRGYCEKIASFLRDIPVKAIVIACNTASAVALEEVKQIAGDIPVYDVVFPAAQYALSVSKTGVIGIAATKTTINTHIYRRLLTKNAHYPIKVKEKATLCLCR
jgi:glutamate racemase